MLFFSEGRIRLCMILSGIACCINLVLNVVLIPVWGIEGAALASLISYAVLGGTSFVVMLQRSRFTLKQATVSDQGLLYELNSLIKLLK